MKHTTRIAFITLLGTLALPALAGERPPADALPLSVLAERLEARGYAPIAEASFDDGRWEIEAYKGRLRRELRVNPHSGGIVSERADD